uniref:ubiquitinyl hydrolase 1 n=1 Tax=Timema monikensis TaxID=170555 RepID=A0A7R9EBX5_9NEOP|nr:unnamed protein product [Timema monikensis]
MNNMKADTVPPVEALRQSLDEGQKQKQQEDIELEEAIKLSLFEHQIPTDTENNIYNQLSLDDKNEEMEESPELSYKIIGAITHHGFTPNSGHYVADVFSFHQHSWYHYDDETAQEKPEEDVLGHNLQCNGYVFFYMYSDSQYMELSSWILLSLSYFLLISPPSGVGRGQMRDRRLVSKLGTGSGQLAGSERVDRLVSKLGTGSGQLAGTSSGVPRDLSNLVEQKPG